VELAFNCMCLYNVTRQDFSLDLALVPEKLLLTVVRVLVYVCFHGNYLQVAVKSGELGGRFK
jgi:hypothetical protein